MRASPASSACALFSRGSERRVLDLSVVEDAPAYVDLANVSGGRTLALVGTPKDVSWRLFGGGDPYDAKGWPVRGMLTTVTSGGPQRPARGRSCSSILEPTPPSSDGAVRRGAHRGRRRSIFGSSTAIQDASGRLHVIADTTSAGPTTCVLYARTGPRSSQWFGRTTVLFKTGRRGSQRRGWASARVRTVRASPFGRTPPTCG